MKKKFTILILTAIGFLMLAGMGMTIFSGDKIYINEVRSTTVSADRDSYFGSDYIELYNASSKEISLDGWFFSDDAGNLEKSRISDVVIPPKSYAALYADGVGEAENSLNFKISSSGEKLFLSDSEGVVVDRVYVPKLGYGEVYARVMDGAPGWAIMSETLLSDNSKAELYPSKTLEEPAFSHESGFYKEPFVLKLQCNPGEKIYYTLDGSVPTKESLVYKDGIFIENISDRPNVCTAVKNLVEDWMDKEPPVEKADKATVVRAVAMNGDKYASEVVTHTYFVDLEKYESHNIISVVGDYNDFFGDDGIFVTGKRYDDWYLSGMEGEAPAPLFAQSGREWEIEGNLEIFQEGKEVTNQSAGIRTHGGSSRWTRFKRMSYFCRDIYSESEYFDGFLIGGKKIHSMGTNEDFTSIQLQSLAKNRDVATQDYEAADVFLNGEFWTQSCLLGRYDEYYFEQSYGVSPDNIILIKDGELSKGEDDDILFYYDLLSRAMHKDLSIEEEYQKLESKMDIQSYIDFLCANIYLCNMDVSETKNYCLWRVREPDGTQYGDGRFRWMLYDMDCIDFASPAYYGVERKAAINSFNQKMEFTGTAINEHTLYKGLKSNEKFCRQFVLTFMDMANVNFNYENVEKIFAGFGTPPDKFGSFFARRFEYIVPDMAEEFSLSGTLEDVNLKVNDSKGGTILLNTVKPDLSDGSWTGKYFTDYPITVTAVPEDGYQFAGWSGSVTSDSATIEAEIESGGITLEAVFEKAAE